VGGGAGGHLLLAQSRAAAPLIEFSTLATRRIENAWPLPKEIRVYTGTPTIAVSPTPVMLVVHQAQTESDIMLVENFNSWDGRRVQAREGTHPVWPGHEAAFPLDSAIK